MANTDGSKVLDISAIADDFTSSALNVGVESNPFENLVIDLTSTAGPLSVGDVVTVQVEIQNTGTAEAALGTMKLRYPSAAFERIQSETVAGVPDEGVVQWNSGQKIAAGETMTLPVEFKAKEVGSHQFNLAYITPEFVTMSYKETVRVLFKKPAP